MLLTDHFCHVVDGQEQVHNVWHEYGPKDPILESLPETVKHDPGEISHDDILFCKEVNEIFEALTICIKPA